MRELESIREQLSEKDYRLTPQREAILRILIEQQAEHLSADEIYLASKQRFPEIGLATVYRTLDLFEQLGIVYKLDSGDGQARYEFKEHGERHYHHHLICVTCGKIIEFNEDLIQNLEQIFAERANFKITDHSLRFFGICDECQRKG